MKRRDFLVSATTGVMVASASLHGQSSSTGTDPGPRHLSSWDPAVGRGDPSVDHAALQAALNNVYAVDIAGLKLKLNKTITITNPEACLMSSIPGQWTGSGHAARSAKIEVVDDALDVLFHVKSYNARFYGIQFVCSGENNTTTILKFLRDPTDKCDIDTDIRRCVFIYGSKHIEVFGRGLTSDGNTFTGAQEAAIVLDWPSEWLITDRSNDQLGTAERAYSIYNTRSHGNNLLLRNNGKAAHRIKDILMTGVQGDTGNAIFKGVLQDSTISNVICNQHATANTVYHITGGSARSSISNFRVSGYFDGSVLRTPNLCFNFEPTADAAIEDIVLANGFLGPSKKEAIRINGDGFCGLSLSNVNFLDCGYYWNAPSINIFRKSDWDAVHLDMVSCKFRYKWTRSDGRYIVGGNQDPKILVTRDVATRQYQPPGESDFHWTAPLMTTVT